MIFNFTDKRIFAIRIILVYIFIESVIIHSFHSTYLQITFYKSS